jgi:hypothetical protein
MDSHIESSLAQLIQKLQGHIPVAFRNKAETGSEPHPLLQFGQPQDIVVAPPCVHVVAKGEREPLAPRPALPVLGRGRAPGVHRPQVGIFAALVSREPPAQENLHLPGYKGFSEIEDMVEEGHDVDRRRRAKKVHSSRLKGESSKVDGGRRAQGKDFGTSELR